MTDSTTQSTTAQTGLAFQTAYNTSRVAGVLVVIFAGLLVANFIGTSVLAARRENRLAAMRAALLQNPADEQLQSDLRQLDLTIRRNRLWRLDFARKGSYALLGSVVLFLAAGKLAGVLTKQPPGPRQVPDRGAEQLIQTRRSRWVVTAGLFAIAGGGGLLFVTQGPLVFVQAEDAGPPYATLEQKSEQWHRFRGPGGLGVSPMAHAPTSWNGKTGEGILWKTAVPLSGFNSPVVWGDRVFLSGATEEKREVFCFDANTGQLLWRGDVPTSPAVAEARIDVLEETGYSASTTATDGRRIYAIFATGDVVAFDFNGRRLWHRNLGIPYNMYGYASSLETYKDRVIIQYDQGHGDEGLSRLYALNGLTGQTVWEVRRDAPNSWTSPVVVDIEGRTQVITLVDPWLAGYDVDTGAEIWRVHCAAGDVAPVPIYAGGLIMAVEPYSRMTAVNPTGQGDVTETHVVWEMTNLAPDTCSPTADDQYVYVLDGMGLLLVCNVSDGETVYEHDLRTYFIASPSIVGDRLYLLSEEGVMIVARTGPEYQEIARSELGEESSASPAFAGGRIYIRGHEHLYCIGPASANETGQ